MKKIVQHMVNGRWEDAFTPSNPDSQEIDNIFEALVLHRPTRIIQDPKGIYEKTLRIGAPSGWVGGPVPTADLLTEWWTNTPPYQPKAAANLLDPAKSKEPPKP